ncbi:hypothetical protein EDB83DRAFT_1654996 [Lactarius deliciosus]|nr:hypothetical protein EDB83DRAFT_1654996 [Lactarius deliciosus]
MPALIPVDNTLGALFIGTVLSSILDRWPLKSLVAFLMLLDTASLVFVIHEPYRDVITNFGDYESNAFKEVSWGQSAITISTIMIEVSVQHFYAYRIYRRDLKHIHDQSSRFEEFLIPTLCCKVLCDVLITVGMVYYLMSHRTQFRRTNNVLNLLAIYFINCGTLHLVFAISCVTMLAKYRNTLIYIPSLFITIRLSLCAFMAVLNSRDTLRETLDKQEDVAMVTSRGRIIPCSAQDTTETSTNTAVSKAFDRDKYPGSSINGISGY